MIPRKIRVLFSRATQHAPTKLACHAAVGAWIALFYYGPQCWPIFAAQSVPELPIDHWIPFQPAWAWVYQSVFIVHTLALWLPANPDAVKTYARNLAAVFAVGAAFFWLFPTLSPRPAQSGSVIYDWLISAVDGPRNAFPSLHAAMSLLAAYFVDRHFRACRAAPWSRICLAVWWAALLYSTLATRQHRLLDLVAGLCIGLLSFALPPVTTQTRHRHETLPTSPHQSPFH